MSQKELHSLYGELANKPVEATRIICRSRLTGQLSVYTVEVMKKAERDCRSLAKEIRMLDGSERCANKAEHIADVHEHYSNEPGKMHNIINQKYRVMYKNTEQDVGTTDFNDEDLMCPFEETNSKKSCWVCHLPTQVWAAMEREYQKDTFGGSK